MDVLASRILLRPGNLAATRAFYRDTLGLGVYREFGNPDDPGTVFFLGGGTPTGDTAIWLQVRDVDVEHDRLARLGVTITRPPRDEPWGLRELWLADPDGVPIVLVQVPPDHPLRRDSRSI
jgi:catechol 2,3-dioxygenase-like lactoylglutathione lyase family enzyme